MAELAATRVKRVIDIAVSAIAVAILSPVLVAVAFAVALESGRPILFRQNRTGRHNREFSMLKFRSMVPDAESVGPYYTSYDDPRVTKVGRFIRRASLDELPQLINVLRGDMSLVGPRPDLPSQRSLYSAADWDERCSVRPGITGLAQALFRSESSDSQRLEADLEYVRKQSLALDVRIAWMTLGRLTGRDAN